MERTLTAADLGGDPQFAWLVLDAMGMRVEGADAADPDGPGPEDDTDPDPDPGEPMAQAA